MNSLSLVTVFGILLVASGLAHETSNLWGGIDPNVADNGVVNNGSLEVYRRIAERRKHDNIAVAPIDTLVILFGIYEYGEDPNLAGFFNSFDPDRNRTTAAKKFEGIGRTLDISLLEMSIGSIRAHRITCHGDVTMNQVISDETGEMHFFNLENSFPHVEQWYRDMNIDVQFNKAEFGGQECVIIFEANYFRHTWQQHRRCVMQSRFHLTKDTFRDDVKYTRMISNLRYGELPELNAKYIVVPWTVREGLAGDTELYVILPNTVDGLSELETRITDSVIQRITYETRTSSMEVILPEIRVTRKYHPLPMIRRVSETPDPVQFYDLVRVTKFDIFRASAYSCYLSPEIESEAKPDLQRFIADHPFLVLFVQKSASEEKSLIAGMLAYRSVEQANN